MAQTRIETKQDIELVRSAFKKFLKECEDLGWETLEIAAWVGVWYDKQVSHE
jgi:phosphosulfolactate synthase (CoM biosynthesis protein A)